jgi:phosphoribosylformylglycinamidine synthase
VRHGEGKFLCAETAVLERIERERLAVLKYSDSSYAAATMAFPENPNGSTNAIAGICDPTGRLMGLMPHPEAFVHYTQHPRWTREHLPEAGDGLLLYQNAAKYVKQNL